MLDELVKKIGEKAALKGVIRRDEVRELEEQFGLGKGFLERLLDDPEEGQRLLGKRYLRLSAILAGSLESHIRSGELSPGDTVRAIPVVAKTARLFLGESTEKVEGIEALVQVLLKEEELDSAGDNPD